VDPTNPMVDLQRGWTGGGPGRKRIISLSQIFPPKKINKKFNWTRTIFLSEEKPKIHSRSERTIFYQASSRRATIPPGFCKK
jgi:hypothetical protein